MANDCAEHSDSDAIVRDCRCSPAAARPGPRRTQCVQRMDRGQVIAQGSPAELIRTHCRGTTVILPWSSVRDDLSDLSVKGRKTAQGIEIQTDDVNGCLKELMDRSVDLGDITVRSPNLEDVFLKLTGRQLRE